MVLGTLGTAALLAGGGTAIGALPDIIPSKFERDQKSDFVKCNVNKKWVRLD